MLSIALLRPLTGQSLRLSLRRHCDVHCVLSFSEIRGVTVKWDDGDELFGNTIVLFGLQVRLPAAATLNSACMRTASACMRTTARA